MGEETLPRGRGARGGMRTSMEPLQHGRGNTTSRSGWRRWRPAFNGASPTWERKRVLKLDDRGKALAALQWSLSNMGEETMARRRDPRTRAPFNGASPTWERKRRRTSTSASRRCSFNGASPTWERKPTARRSSGSRPRPFNGASPTWERKPRRTGSTRPPRPTSFNGASPTWERKPVYPAL